MDATGAARRCVLSRLWARPSSSVCGASACPSAVWRRLATGSGRQRRRQQARLRAHGWRHGRGVACPSMAWQSSPPSARPSSSVCGVAARRGCGRVRSDDGDGHALPVGGRSRLGSSSPSTAWRLASDDRRERATGDGDRRRRDGSRSSSSVCVASACPLMAWWRLVTGSGRQRRRRQARTRAHGWRHGRGVAWRLASDDRRGHALPDGDGADGCGVLACLSAWR